MRIYFHFGHYVVYLIKAYKYQTKGVDTNATFA